MVELLQVKIIRQINVEDDDDDEEDISPPPPPPGSPPPPPVYPPAYPAGYPPSGYVYSQPAAYTGECIEFLKNIILDLIFQVLLLSMLGSFMFTTSTDFVQNGRNSSSSSNGLPFEYI
jgi:hypothetical protein